MSELKLYEPECDAADEPRIFRIEDYAGLRRERRREMPDSFREEPAVDRARILHMNRRCPYCKHPVVEPLELSDGLRNRSRSQLPGTASVVGFQCLGCYHQWPA